MENTILDKTSIQTLLATNDKAVIRALLVIYDRQTEAEKAVGVTKEDNGIGFSGCDAEILSSFAEWYKSKGFLTPKQLAISKNKLKKYWRQLLQISESKGYTVSYTVKRVKKPKIASTCKN